MNEFISVFKLRKFSDDKLSKIVNNPMYRQTTRRNAQNELNLRHFNKVD